MIFFVAMILFVAYAQTIIKLSFLNKFYRWILILSFTLPLLFIYEEAAKINLSLLGTVVNNFGTLTLICMLAIIQEVSALIFGSILLRRYYSGKKIYFWYYAVLLPSGLFPLLCFLTIIYVFNIIGGMDFGITAFFLVAGMILVTGLAVEALTFFGKSHREKLIELLTLVSLIQVFIAMFLPVVLNGKISGESLMKFQFDMVYVWLVMFAVIGVFMFLSHCHVLRKLAAISKRIIGFN